MCVANTDSPGALPCSNGLENGCLGNNFPSWLGSAEVLLVSGCDWENTAVCVGWLANAVSLQMPYTVFRPILYV